MITSAKTLFSNKITSVDTGDSTYLCGTQFNPQQQAKYSLDTLMGKDLLIFSKIFLDKEPAGNTGDIGDVGSIPGLGRFPGKVNDNLLQYS